MFKPDSSIGLSVESVIRDRVQFDNNSPQRGMINAADITKQFVGSRAQANDEMKRCRIRLCLYEDETDNVKITETISKNICDSKNKNFGNFEVATMSKPHKCCNKGGWQIFLVSKSKVGPSGCYPIFVLADPETQDNVRRVEQCFPNFKQISRESYQIVNNFVFIFDVPPQSPNVIRSLKEFKEKVYVTLYRESDGEFATNMVKYDYEVHEEHNDECPYW